MLFILLNSETFAKAYLTNITYIQDVNSEMSDLDFFMWDIPSTGKLLNNQIDQVYESYNDFNKTFAVLKLDINYKDKLLKISDHEYICSFKIFKRRKAALYVYQSVNQNQILNHSRFSLNVNKICNSLNEKNKYFQTLQINKLKNSLISKILIGDFLYADSSCATCDLSQKKMSKILDLKKITELPLMQSISTCTMRTIDKLKNINLPEFSLNSFLSSAKKTWSSVRDQIIQIKNLTLNLRQEISSLAILFKNIDEMKLFEIICAAVQEKLVATQILIGVAAMPLKFADILLSIINKLKESVSIFDRINSANLSDSIKSKLILSRIANCSN